MIDNPDRNTVLANIPSWMEESIIGRRDKRAAMDYETVQRWLLGEPVESGWELALPRRLTMDSYRQPLPRAHPSTGHHLIGMVLTFVIVISFRLAASGPIRDSTSA